MEEIKYDIDELEILYNYYGKFIHFCRKKSFDDGNIVFYELDSDDEIDLESYAIHGYKMIRDKGIILNKLKQSYTLDELLGIEESNDGLSDKTKGKNFSSESLVDLGWLEEYIKNNKYNYEVPVPVEQIEIRYSEVFDDFLFLYVTFDKHKRRLSYTNMENGSVVDREILSLYTFYPRDEIFNQPSYSSNDIIKIKERLKKGKILRKGR